MSSNVRRSAGEYPKDHPQSRRTRRVEQVRSATNSQRDGRRARVILLAAEGRTRVEIARLTGFSLSVITCWCQRFLAQRLEGLIDKSGRGHKPFLPLEAVRRVLEQVTQPCIGEPRWSCRSMARAAGISAIAFDR
ncbi:helix-turn-helix domain-containing protein [Pseudomonas sp. CCC3.1]|uniref:helix-turn-helix domain-containing protein n=1 Tax=Pseudomonas sp. CCC3.1 TaxID=3048607 RepID=UPI003A0FDBCA